MLSAPNRALRLRPFTVDGDPSPPVYNSMRTLASPHYMQLGRLMDRPATDMVSVGRGLSGKANSHARDPEEPDLAGCRVVSNCVEKVIPAESLLALFGTTESAVDRCLRLDLPAPTSQHQKGERVLTPEGLAAAASSTYGHKLACTQIFLVPVVEHLTKILCAGKGLFIGENPIGRPGYASQTARNRGRQPLQGGGHQISSGV